MATQIIIDGTKLSHKKLIIFNSTGKAIEVINPENPTEKDGWFNPRRKAIFLVEPDTYSVVVQSGVFTTFNFEVDVYGLIKYDSVNSSFLAGNGSTTLVLNGFNIQLDFQNLSSGGLYIPTVMGNDDDIDIEWTKKANYNLLPANGYCLIAASGLVAEFSLNISNKGILTTNSKGTYYKIIGKTKLIITGYPIIIDAKSIKYTDFWINVNNVPHSINGIIKGNFLPLQKYNTYSLGAFISDDPSASVNLSHQTFTILSDGNIEVNDPFTYKVDTSNNIKRVTLLKRLSEIITNIELSKNEIQAGESLKIEVHTINAEAVIQINGITGKTQYFQFENVGKVKITIQAFFKNYYETKIIEVNVIPFSGIANLKSFPLLHHSQLLNTENQSIYNSVFSINRDIFNQEGYSLNWDFGDGTFLETTKLEVNHDYEAFLDPDIEHYNFHIKCLIKQENQPEVSVSKTLYLHNTYALCKKLGTIISKTTNEPLLTKINENWESKIQIKNIEQEAINFTSFLYYPLSFIEDEPNIPVEQLIDSFTVAANSIQDFPFSIGSDQLSLNSIGISIILIGNHANGLPVRTESFFQFPAKGQIANNINLQTIINEPFHAINIANTLMMDQHQGPLVPLPPIEGGRCEPDNSPDEIADDGDSNWVCQATQEIEIVETEEKFINARKGDILLSPGGPGLIGQLLNKVSPPQLYSHCGIMTRNFDQVTHCTASEDRLLDYPVGSVPDPEFSDPFKTIPAPTNGFRSDILKYGWPGVITQSVPNTIHGEGFIDPENNKTYHIGAFNGSSSYGTAIGGWTIIPPLVVKPDPLLELRFPTVRPMLHKVANEALSQNGKAHYRFYCYTDASILTDPTKKGPENSGWAADTFPAVCSSFIWGILKKLGVHAESNNQIVDKLDLEPSDLFDSKGNIVGAEINSETKDGLYLYSAEERRAGADYLYNALYEKINKQLEEKGIIGEFLGATSDIRDDVANQIVNAFATDWCDTEAKDSDNWKNTIASNAVSPDNILLWDSPLQKGLYGFASPLLVRPKIKENIIISRWRKVSNRGSLSGVVTFNNIRQASIDIQLFDNINGITKTNENGEYFLSHVPFGNYNLKAINVVEGHETASNVLVSITQLQNNLDIQLNGPTGKFRKLIINANIFVRDDNERVNPENDRHAFADMFLDFENNRTASTTLSKNTPGPKESQFGSLRVNANLNFDGSIHIDLEANCSDFNGDKNAGSFIIEKGQTKAINNIHCMHNPDVGARNWTDISATFFNDINPIL
jgi:hypothetical protein